MSTEIPVIDASNPDFKEQLEFNLWSLQSSSDYSNDRARPYNGQPWTDHGERGKTEVQGLTMRDISDCLMKAMLRSAPESGKDIIDHALERDPRKELLSEKVDKGTWRYQDVYQIDFSQVDPIAIAQNLTCEIEKMMGIFPNVAKLTAIDGIV